MFYLCLLCSFLCLLCSVPDSIGHITPAARTVAAVALEECAPRLATIPPQMTLDTRTAAPRYGCAHSLQCDTSGSNRHTTPAHSRSRKRTLERKSESLPRRTAALPTS